MFAHSLRLCFVQTALEPQALNPKPHCMQVPEDGVGGHLQIFQRGRGDPAKDALVLAAPDAVLEPEENTNVQIRGDAYVQMDGFRSLGAGVHLVWV